MLFQAKNRHSVQSKLMFTSVATVHVLHTVYILQHLHYALVYI